MSVSVQKLMMGAAGGLVGGSKSYTTPGTYYWTAPAGVTMVDLTAQGGSDLATPAWQNYNIFSIAYDASITSRYTNLYGSSFTYENAEAVLASMATTANSITTSSSGAYYNGMINRRIYGKFNGDGLWYTQHYVQWDNTLIRRIGTFSTSYNFGTGEVTDNAFTTKYITGAQLQAYTFTYTFGTASQAFGYTFNRNQPQLTYTGVPVTAGTTYTIVVGTDQGADTAFVNFNYY